jgi:hypothetical protein
MNGKEYFFFLNGLPFLNMPNGSASIGTGLFGDGTAAAPSMSLASEATGWYKSGVNVLGISIGGTGIANFGIINSGLRLQSQIGGCYLDLNGAGNIGINAAGSNQSITLSPSGTGNGDFVIANGGIVRMLVGATLFADFGNTTASAGLTINSRGTTNFLLRSNGNTGIAIAPTSGNVLLGGLTTDLTGVLQFPAATTAAGGITFGTDTNIYRAGAGILATTATSLQGATTGNFYISSAAASQLVLQQGGTNCLIFNGSQQASFQAGILVAPPRTIAAATGTLATADFDLIVNNAGTCTLTLGTATAGRTIYIRTITANTVISASSNIVPAAGGAAGTAILAATAGKWAKLVGDGSNWQIQASN